MAKLITVQVHEVASAYLNLRLDKVVDIVYLNPDLIASADYKENYPNGYGQYLHYLRVKTMDKGSYTFYAEDADAAMGLLRLHGVID